MQTDETSGIKVEGHIKIYDPISNEIYVNKRCDGIPSAPSIADINSNRPGYEPNDR
jgi:hypothetical protein